MNHQYTLDEPTRSDVDALRGATLIEFGSPDCGWCMAAQPRIASALADHADLRHLKIADGRGRPLGRSFGVKLWPTLIFLKDGREVGRLVRPETAGPIAAAVKSLDD